MTKCACMLGVVCHDRSVSFHPIHTDRYLNLEGTNINRWLNVNDTVLLTGLWKLSVTWWLKTQNKVEYYGQVVSDKLRRNRGECSTWPYIMRDLDIVVLEKGAVIIIQYKSNSYSLNNSYKKGSKLRSYGFIPFFYPKFQFQWVKF